MSAIAAGGTPKVELRGVKKRFGPKVVLDGIDLTVNAGDSLVIIGGSGSGKSVTIKCVLGIVHPDSGTIKVDGEEVTRLRGGKRDAFLRKFGMLFQGGALFDSLPVWENVGFGLIQGRGVSRSHAREIAIEKLAKVGLGPEVANLSPAELSGGMLKRVGLARAIAADPEIIFFDEPTTGLDPILVNTIHRLILALHSRHAFTALIVSHEIPEIFEIADQVAMLSDGRIVEHGPPAAIQASQNPVVRQFIRGEPEP